MGTAVLGGLTVKIMDQMEAMADMVSPAWINYLADRSRKRKAPGMRPQGKYSKAGIQR